MWKATAGVKPSIAAKPSGKPAIPKKKDLTADDDDEWETDADFVVCQGPREWEICEALGLLRQCYHRFWPFSIAFIVVSLLIDNTKCIILIRPSKQ